MRFQAASALALVFLAASGLASQAAAQVTDTAPPPASDTGNRIVTYQPDYFAEFQVSTALDMVFHVPGFNLNTGDDDVRGFAGAAGNVIIDGPVSYTHLTLPTKRIV